MKHGKWEWTHKQLGQILLSVFFSEVGSVQQKKRFTTSGHETKKKKVMSDWKSLTKRWRVRCFWNGIWSVTEAIGVVGLLLREQLREVQVSSNVAHRLYCQYLLHENTHSSYLYFCVLYTDSNHISYEVSCDST